MNIGKCGERLFKNIMESRDYIVNDVSNNPEYWSKDIDFIITSSTSGLTKTFEVKWDSKINRTGNLYLETLNIRSKGGKGWYEFCEADYLAYADAATKTFYVIPLLELKKKVKKLCCRQVSCDDGGSVGILVSLKDISDIVQVL